jgi:hypothetical protein
MIVGFAVAIGLLTANDGPHRTDVPAQIRSEQNPSPYQYRKLSLGKFDQLKVAGPFQVFVLVGRESSVDLQGPPELLADTVATVEGGTLNIRFREGAKWSWNPGSGMNVIVFTPKLSSAHIEGAAQVEIHGATGVRFSAATEGSGGIALHNVGARVVELSTVGAGGITAEGSALEATYIVGGAGSIDAKRMHVNKATITVDGSGESFADVSDTATISVHGSGRVQVVGGANCVKLPPNSPRVECR